MGAPSREQIDEAIAGGVARREDEDTIVERLAADRPAQVQVGRWTLKHVQGNDYRLILIAEPKRVCASPSTINPQRS
jgi:hypothetical protein